MTGIRASESNSKALRNKGFNDLLEDTNGLGSEAMASLSVNFAVCAWHRRWGVLFGEAASFRRSLARSGRDKLFAGIARSIRCAERYNNSQY